MITPYLILLTMLPTKFTASCGNVVRLADLQDIINNQTELIRDQKQANEELHQVVKDQKDIIMKQAKLIHDLRKTTENATSDESLINLHKTRNSKNDEGEN